MCSLVNCNHNTYMHPICSNIAWYLYSLDFEGTMLQHLWVVQILHCNYKFGINLGLCLLICGRISNITWHYYCLDFSHILALQCCITWEYIAFISLALIWVTMGLHLIGEGLQASWPLGTNWAFNPILGSQWRSSSSSSSSSSSPSPSSTSHLSNWGFSRDHHHCCFKGSRWGRWCPL